MHKPSCRIFSLLLAGLSAWTEALVAVPAARADLSMLFPHGASAVEHAAFSGKSGSSRKTLKSKRGEPENSPGDITWENVDEDVVRVHVNNTGGEWTGASFSFPNDTFYGVWEYPWDGAISNKNVTFEIKGLFGDQPGINYANVRAPFFFTRSGFAVYIDTLEMGTFVFDEAGGVVEFVFYTPTLTYSVIHKPTPAELLTTYANLSSTIEMPPDSGYGPNFWSDNIEEDFHGNVSNSQENFFDIADHLYENRIRATAMFADRPYGTGNSSYGNFDFDPVYFPSPEAFIANLSERGFDFQVWVANRAFYHTELYNTSVANNWLFPGIDGARFLGPALNLSIPEAYAYLSERLSTFARLGVRGFKIDRGEEHEMPDGAQNEQATLFAQLCHDVMADRWGSTAGGFFNFARSAVDRSRSRAAAWNGDSQADFAGLAYSVASGIRAGLLGFAVWGSDTGGYVRDGARPTAELWARWMHFSAFSPLYEVPVGLGHTPWYDDDGDGALVGVLRATADTHTRLVPYMRSYARLANRTGIPIVRALFLDHPGDGRAYGIADEYGFGAEFLVAPIVAEGGRRTVYFPRGGGGGGDNGARYLEYFNKTAVYAGGTSANVSMGIEYMPVYVREGAIVPTGDVYQGNAKWIEDWRPSLEIEVFPSFDVPESRFEYYGGDGRTSSIAVTTDRENQTVRIAYDPFDVDGRFAVYGKSGVSYLDIPSGNASMRVSVSQFESLFD